MKKRSKEDRAAGMDDKVFRTLAWWWLWERADRPTSWRACGYGIEFGDGIAAADLPW